jgi:hypothetical protein
VIIIAAVKSLVLVCVSLVLPCVASGNAFADCPVTLRATSPVEVPGQPSNSYQAWYGSDRLAVLLPTDGRWRGMGAKHKFRDKFWIWRRGYEPGAEARPDLTLSGVKLHGDAPQRLENRSATNAYGDGWSSMLTLLEFPSAGCWQVTATYVHAGIREELTFIVHVE